MSFCVGLHVHIIASNHAHPVATHLSKCFLVLLFFQVHPKKHPRSHAQITIEGSPKNGPWVALNLQSGLGNDEVTSVG